MSDVLIVPETTYVVCVVSSSGDVHGDPDGNIMCNTNMASVALTRVLREATVYFFLLLRFFFLQFFLFAHTVPCQRK